MKTPPPSMSLQCRCVVCRTRWSRRSGCSMLRISSRLLSPVVMSDLQDLVELGGAPPPDAETDEDADLQCANGRPYFRTTVTNRVGGQLVYGLCLGQSSSVCALQTMPSEGPMLSTPTHLPRPSYPRRPHMIQYRYNQQRPECPSNLPRLVFFLHPTSTASL